MQHSTTLHPASEWPVLLLNNTYIILIRSDHHRFMISFLGGWLQVFFLFNPFLGGVVGVMGFISWAKMTTWRFWRFFSAHQAPWASLKPFMVPSRTSLHHRNLLIFARLWNIFPFIWRWYLMILSSCGKCFLSSLSKELRMEKSQEQLRG